MAKKVQFTYRIKSNAGANVRVYEVGEINEPRTSPDLWCDRRICEGFWGSETDVRRFVAVLNKNWDEYDQETKKAEGLIKLEITARASELEQVYTRKEIEGAIEATIDKMPDTLATVVYQSVREVMNHLPEKLYQEVNKVKLKPILTKSQSNYYATAISGTDEEWRKMIGEGFPKDTLDSLREIARKEAADLLRTNN